MSDSHNAQVVEINEAVAEKTADLKSTWKEAPRRWGHSMHRLAPYVGGFPPSLAHYFIKRFSDIGDTVLDPFCGSGTTPLQAALSDRQGLGNDAFSYAYTLSRAKCNPIKKDEFQGYLEDKLEEMKEIENENLKLLDDEDLLIFYSEHTLDKILRLREVLQGDDSTQAEYLKAIMCGILHGSSDMYLSLQTKDLYPGTANYVKEYAEEHGLERPEKDIKPSIEKKHKLVHKDLIPVNLNEETKITKSDARELPFADEEADFILTSPPYMQTLDYIWNNWIRLWWLDKDRDKERESIDITQDTEKYRNFMRMCLQEMYRVLSPDSVAVLIVGDVNKYLSGGKQTLNTSAFIAEEAEKHTEFEVHGVIHDAYDIDSRSYLHFDQLKYDHCGENKDMETIDRCLILKKGNPEVSHEPSIDWEREPYVNQSLETIAKEE